MDTRDLTLSQWRGSLAKEIENFHNSDPKIPHPHPHPGLPHPLFFHFRDQPSYRVRTLTMQSTALLVGVIHLLTSYSGYVSGPDLQAGNQSRTDISKMDPNDQEIPLTIGGSNPNAGEGGQNQPPSPVSPRRTTPPRKATLYPPGAFPDHPEHDKSSTSISSIPL